MWVDEPGNKEIQVKRLTSWIARIEGKIARFPELKFEAEEARLVKLKEQLAKLQ